MVLQVRQCLDEGAVGRQVESPPDHFLGVLAVCLEFDSLDDVGVLELRQDGQRSDEADCQRVFTAVLHAQVRQLVDLWSLTLFIEIRLSI